ncbi:MAG TPA: TlpA disulfide reductase family protein [Verrucomicrobiota bacterium]|nr:hypothetical protein [Verrucomicrobiales bacterium]HRI15406.1 TlpA disulfide reductase family protein [Verrucomicrobiota bacterium]
MLLQFVIGGLILVCATALVGGWLVWQVLRQNGRILLRLEELERRLDEIEFGEGEEPADQAHSDNSEIRNPKSEIEESLVTPAATNGDGRASRFNNRSLSRSRIQRDGLKAGTRAPDFLLPRLDGRGDLALEEFRGRRLLLIFSDPHCGPCQALAPHLEEFHRTHPELPVVMISRGEPAENRAKVKEHGLTFPVVMQQQWEISRRYAMFATPMAYLIDGRGVIAREVAVGPEPIRKLLEGFAEVTIANASLQLHRFP